MSLVFPEQEDNCSPEDGDCFAGDSFAGDDGDDDGDCSPKDGDGEGKGDCFAGDDDGDGDCFAGDKDGDSNAKKKDNLCPQEIFIVYCILITLLTLLIFLTIIRGFIIPAINKDIFLPIFIICLFTSLAIFIVVCYENHSKTEDYVKRNLLFFTFLIQSVVLAVMLSQFFTHGNTYSTALLAALLCIIILFWYIWSYKSPIRNLLLIYFIFVLVFGIFLLYVRKRFETS
jgi:hypothetical protein